MATLMFEDIYRNVFSRLYDTYLHGYEPVDTVLEAKQATFATKSESLAFSRVKLLVKENYPIYFVK